MSTPIKPLADKIVAAREEAVSKTANGIFLPDSSREKSQIAVVKAIGVDVKYIKVGNRIVYKEYSTTDLRIDGVDYLILKEEDVLATL